jgi:uncharacterized protein YjeT (DUF2065 family)
MDISLFLAKLLGLYFLIVAILCIFRKRQMATTGKELASSRSALAVSGEISLLFGLVIAVDHSIWEMSWVGLITLLGYLLILKGILRFAFPARVKELMAKVSNGGYWLICLIMLAVGAYLTYCGFTYS